MAGRSTSEEMDAVSFDEVTPPRPVSIYDLDEDVPTRAQSSDEIAEFQRKARERRDPTHRSFRKTSEPASASSARPIPRESGPVLVERPKAARALSEPELDLDQVLNDVEATIAKLPPAPLVPKFDDRDLPESLHAAKMRPLPAVPPPPRRAWARWGAWLVVSTLVVIAAIAFAR